MHTRAPAPIRASHSTRTAPAWLAIGLVALAAVAAEPASAQAGAAAPHPSVALAAAFDDALRAYERNHWTEAYDALAKLGDAGHPEAARMALDMWRFGPRLYGTAFTATSAQVERWSRVWGCGGDATGYACQIALQGCAGSCGDERRADIAPR